MPLEDTGQVADAAPIDEATFVVVMTHNFLRDKDYLRGLLRSDGRLHRDARAGRAHPAPPDGARAEGVDIADEDRARIHGPAGLDLGAEGPEEIAQAIVAEIVAVSHDRSGGSSRNVPARSTIAPARSARSERR